MGWLASALLVLASILLSLAVFEVGLRIFTHDYPQFYQRDALVGWRPRPGVSGWVPGSPDVEVAINREGYRNVDHAVAKPPGTYRIVVLGDSMSEAVEVPLEQVYWRRLGAFLRDCPSFGPAVEVISFAVNGYGTGQEYLTFREHALKYRPDLVLLAFFTGNDITDNSFVLGLHSERPYFAIEGGQLRLVRKAGDASDFAIRQWWNDLRTRTIDEIRVVQVARRAERNIRDWLKYGNATGSHVVQPGLDNGIFTQPTGPDWDAAWRVTEALILAIADMAKANGADFAMTTLTNPLQVLPDPADRETIRQNLGLPDLLYPDRRLAAFAAEHGILDVPLVEPIAAYAAEHRVALHGDNPVRPVGHWNALGHEVAVTYLGDALCRAKSAGRLAAGG